MMNHGTAQSASSFTRKSIVVPDRFTKKGILVKANAIDEAIERAESLAKEYANDLEGCSYTGFVDVFHIYDENIEDGSEVYSLMRTSDLPQNDYLNQFYDTGMERTQK